ncbi:MAG: hypothetical protein KDA20_09210 [Phycisphaerales bacterium]|nr:hypothetical protein [Phycisphaerales bacterium]
MAFTPQPGERYTIRRKILKLLGAAFHIYGPDGSVVGYCKQKAFKLREDIRLYTDESCTTELLTMRARQVIDFGVTFEVTLPDGQVLASIRRKGLKSMFRDTWQVFLPGQDTPRATLQEDSALKATLRRLNDLVATFVPQSFHLTSSDGLQIATLRQHFNLFVYRLGVKIEADDPVLDELVVLALGCLIAAIEGRQN